MKTRVVVAGWAQVTQRKDERDIRDPLGLMAAASRAAFEKARSRRLLRRLDGMMVVRPLSRHYNDVAGQLAEKIGAAPRFTLVSKIGGHSPQSLINKAAGMIARHELDTVLIAGAEAYYPRNGKPFHSENILFQGLPQDYQGDDTIGSTEAEIQHGVVQPMHGFPLYETALWADSGLGLEPYLLQVGKRWSHFSRIAADHPYAWTRTPRTAREIITPTQKNRRIAFPYTKFMNPLVTADLGAAIILTSEEKGRDFAQREKRPVYFLGGAYAEDRQRFLIQKTDFISSPPLKAAVDKALERSRRSLDDIQCFDFYSCFPCSVSIAQRMLEIKDDDPRPLTITGGLGFFGGPGNNYSLHAVATLSDIISGGEKDHGLITSLGWFLHKHAVGVYSAFPAETDPAYHDLADEKNCLAGRAPVEITERPSGKGVIETYTVVHSREGQPAYAVIYGRTDEGNRFIAQTQQDPDVFSALETRNHVGRAVRLLHDKKQGRNTAELV